MYPAVRSRKDSCEYPEGKPLSRGGIQEAVQSFTSSIFGGDRFDFFYMSSHLFRRMFCRGLDSQFKDTESNWLSMLVATTISSEGVGGKLTITMLTYLEQHPK